MARYGTIIPDNLCLMPIDKLNQRPLGKMFNFAF